VDLGDTADITGVLAAAINAQTGTTYTVVAGDKGKLVTLSNGSSVAVTQPQATGSFTTGYSVTLANKGAGVVTITPTTSTIDGQSSVVLNQYESITLVSDGTNYSSSRGKMGLSLTTTGSSGAASLTGTVLNIPQYSGGGGNGDWLSTLLNTEVSITTTATATISKQHVCSGTSYTVTLPAASGNGGKFLALRITATGLITVDGNGSETIDGALTRVMWAGESCMLYCDGSNWFKTAGKTIPMICVMYRNTDSINSVNGAITNAGINTTTVDNTGLMANTGSNKMTIKRAGYYIHAGKLVMSNSSTIIGNAQVLVQNASTIVAAGIASLLSSSNGFFTISTAPALLAAAADDITINYIHDAAGGSTAPVIIGGAAYTSLSLTEVPTW